LTLREFLSKDWISIFFDKVDEKEKQIGHKLNDKLNHKTFYQKLNENTKPKRNLNPFKRKKRLSY